MYSPFRLFVRKLHTFIDATAGKLMGGKSLETISKGNHQKVNILEHFDDYAYSKKSHFEQFEIPPVHARQTLKTADLKVYQDAFILTFIKQNIKPGSKILEIGGGQSRLIPLLKDDYELWNLDKLEGAGFGPKKAYDADGHTLVRDYIGAFSEELEDHSFDFIYSISTIEHIPQDNEFVDNVLSDIQRLLAPNAVTLHCVDALLHADHLEVHPIVQKVSEMNQPGKNIINFGEISNDKALWSLPFYAYYTRWYHLTKKRLKQFGKPISVNVLWK